MSRRFISLCSFMGLVLLITAPSAGAVSTDAPWLAAGQAANDDFGSAVASAGDFNGDGYEDWIVGAHFNDGAGSGAGAAHIFYGGPNADTEPGLTLYGAAAGDEFGFAVAGIGDVNDDGFDDVLVGAPYNDAVASNAGRAYVFYGGALPNATADLTLNGDQANDNFGRSVSAAGDFNADGYPDFLVGGKFLAGLLQDNGRVEVFLGGPGLSSSSYFDLFGTNLGDYLGYSMAPAGDYNGDGFDDLVVGAPFNDDVAGNAGKAYIYFGGYDFDQYPDLGIGGLAADDQFGYAVTGGGDFNGDGFGDIAVTAIASDAGGTNAGAVSLFLGYDPPNITVDLTFYGDAQGGYFGYALAGPVDLNADGYGDLAVSAPTLGSNPDLPSQLKVYLGSAGLNNSADLVVQAPYDDELGEALAAAGDLDGDGRRDLLVGAPGAGGGGQARIQSVFPYRVLRPNGGETWIAGEAATVEWRGRDLADVAVSVDGGLTWSTMLAGAGGEAENTARVVAPAAETDVALVRVTYTGQTAALKTSDTGDAAFRIVAAQEPPPVSTLLTMALAAETPGDYFGFYVATVGDVNGDDYEDFLVSAPYSEAGGTSSGRVYLYFGGPGLDDVPDLVFTGASAAFTLGIAVAGGGDFDGDGYADFALAAPYENTMGTNAGAVYLYRGGPGVDAVADFTFYAEAAEDQFGSSLALLGDVNGDGADDLLVGTDLNDANGTSSGRAYLYFGGPGADTTPDLIMTGEAALDFLGFSLASAGDLNADGFADFVIGAYGVDGAGSQSGRAYVYLGGTAVDGEADLVLDGRSTGDVFGYTVSGAGDVDGDGYDDLLVGAHYQDAGGTNAGAAYYFRGGARLDGQCDLVLTGEAANDYFGFVVSGGRDLNGDGYDDMVVAATENDAGGSGAGRVYVYFGGPIPDAVPDLLFNGEAVNDEYGCSVAPAGDLDGDGHAELLIGAKYNDIGGSNAGRAYVYSFFPYRVLSPNGGEKLVAGSTIPVKWLGSAPADVALSRDGGGTWTTLLEGVGGREENRVEVTLPADLTELARVRVSRSGEAPAAQNSDRSDGVFAMVPPASPVAFHCEWAPVGETAGDNFGSTASGAGDVNGDGYADIIVGTQFNDAGGTNAGRAYVLYGGPHADLTADLVMTGEAPDDRFGISSSGAGDFNGDGYDDVIVGAHYNDAGGSLAGRAYLFFGGPGADAVADLTLTGLAAGDYFGASVSGAGDVNGDGFADVIVGAYLADGVVASSGVAYVFFGGSAADATADLVLNGEAGADRFGQSVSGAGDVNGDGYDDVVVGAYYADGGGLTNSGKAYVFYGGSVPDDEPDLILAGETVDDRLGYSVAGAGDVNGDGFDDIAAGAPNQDAGGSNAGAVYLYFGGPDEDTLPDLVLIGEAAGDNFGWPVAGAGDVNGDGFADVMVGARNSDLSVNNGGRAYVFFGGQEPDEIADAVLIGEVAEGYLGMAVSGVGDVTGDGIPDVLAAAPGDGTAGAGAGRVLVYDFARYHVVTPVSGTTWNVGAAEEIRWLGAEPADVWLSVDGGNSYSLLADAKGGAAQSGFGLTVPHQPTRFAKIKLTPSNPAVRGSAVSDSLFTIEASIALLNLKAAPFDGGGVLLSWQTDPGPEDLAGYRVERADGDDHWRTLVALTRETQYHDESGAAGMSYRLFGVNGLGDELLLGETALTPRAALSAWPLPYRGGDLTVSFLTAAGLGGAAAPGEVALFDLQGRRVRTLARGVYASGFETAVWDGRDDAGRPVSSGVYFLRAVSAGETTRIKLTVLR